MGEIFPPADLVPPGGFRLVRGDCSLASADREQALHNEMPEAPLWIAVLRQLTPSFPFTPQFPWAVESSAGPPQGRGRR
jgi:hypothetical protein